MTSHRHPGREHDDFDDDDLDDQRRRRVSRIKPVLVIVGGLLILEHISGTDIDILQLGGGVFFLCWWAKTRNLWQLLVGLFLVLGPLGAVLGGLGMAGTGHQSLLPVLVISAGALMVFRRNLQPGVLGALWMVVVVSVVISITSSWDRPGRMNRNRGPDPIEESIPTVPPVQRGGVLPALRGRPVLIKTRDDDVSVTTTDSPAPLETGVVVVSTPELVILTVSDETDIELPTSTGVQVVSRDGDVRVSVVGDPDVQITTTDGDIDLDGYDEANPEGTFSRDGTGSGAVTVTTRSGDIDLEKTAAKLR